MTSENKRITKAQVRGVETLSDLCANGYRVRCRAMLLSGHVYILEHRKTRRVLRLVINRLAFSLWEKGKKLKGEAYVENGLPILADS